MTDRPNKGDSFRCECCGGEFEAAREHDEAKAESDALFPGVDWDCMAIVCHDCWLKMGFGQ